MLRNTTRVLRLWRISASKRRTVQIERAGPAPVPEVTRVTHAALTALRVTRVTPGTGASAHESRV